MNLTEFNQSDLCVHFSCPKRSVFPAFHVLLYVCSAAVVLLTVCGNLLIIISVFHFKQLHTPSNMLVLSLAVSDFLVGAFLMPPMFSWTIESCWIFGTLFCTIFWLIDGFLTILSIYNIALIAVDRYLALSNPFLYTNTVSRINMCIVINSNLIVCVVYNTVFYYFNGTFKSSAMCPGECSFFLNEGWSVIDLTYAFIFPLSVIITLYTQVFVIAKKHATAIRELNNNTRSKTQKITSHSMKSERKAAKVLGILVSVFLLCLFPYFIFSLLGDNIEVQTETTQKVLIILYLNSMINPIIYALFYPWFRRCFKLILTLRILQSDSELINVLL
ncbi:trace amine-associated receptor 13c-like [Clarias gariepinus]|uniref:trace amine-associated receptor 13c-like n=1 Tax=Clarias gariepinus TaxID=13013 RepID=UPI00234C522E|nr:trace amine-associated receptor 13c-like [Clarias gariepinus]